MHVENELPGTPAPSAQPSSQTADGRPDVAIGKEAGLWFLGVVFAGIVLCLSWVTLSRFGSDDGFRSRQGESLSDLLTNKAPFEMWSRYIRTFFRVVVSWAVGLAGGTLVGTVIGQSRGLRRVVDPLLNVMRFFVPMAVGAVAIWLWGFGYFGMLIACLSIPFWFAADAVARLVENSRRTSQKILLREKVSVVRTTLLLAVLTCFSIEYLADGEGFGYLIFRGANQYDLSLVMVISMVAAISGLVLDSLIRLLAFKMNE